MALTCNLFSLLLIKVLEIRNYDKDGVCECINNNNNNNNGVMNGMKKKKSEFLFNFFREDIKNLYSTHV